MLNRIDAAIQNNVIWCDLVCQSHGVAGKTSGHLWGVLSNAPPYYPDMITLNKNMTVQEIQDFIGSREIRAIKDSFANVELTPLGFKLLFSAEWIYHAPIHLDENTSSAWRVVTTEHELEKWNLAHASENVIKPSLLNRDDVRIFIQNEGDGISGFIANLGADTMGISNVFSAQGVDKQLWADIIKAASLEFPGVPMVGYEHGKDLEMALLAGWQSLGPLRVWSNS
ncbi:hypothetical protein E5161_06875 [Cohnella pontilimi]|uniref:Uncharacterized protein n=1 Tax=Cohnella pontilimi TaxID=2564100 RepID=A0A4U0FGS1_9BACL|nr:hypothetical protein [Cohnella pontilimi]TJY42572.1 hypothetical protein E5161_06875 [Cohnella pontilimi]